MKKISLLRQVLVIGVLLCFSGNVFGEVKTKEVKVKVSPKAAIENMEKFIGNGESLSLSESYDVNKDKLFYMDLHTAKGSVPNLKFYPDKKFKGRPIAELNNKGLIMHDKLVCKWVKTSFEEIETRVMHIVGKMKPCVDIGVAQSSLNSMSGDGRLDIVIDNTTPEYYEIILNNEKFYINPKEIRIVVGDSDKGWGKDLKAWGFLESFNKTSKRKAEEYKKLPANPEIVKFLKEKSKCVKKKDFKCLVGEKGEDAIASWLANICAGIEGGSNNCSVIKNKNYYGHISYEYAKFEGDLVEIFWKHALACNLDKNRHAVGSDHYNIALANVGLAENFTVICVAKKYNYTTWQFEMEIEEYTGD